ncbi:MAG: DUF4840 domain-containing protein [Prevotella sp.]|nr:DUF4840 domain-containing protein [Prevotella sp.]
MKNLKLIFLALGCMAALSLTSCLKNDDNNNNGLSEAQIAQCVNAVRGEYTGKLVYPSQGTQYYDNADTVDVSWSIGADTMLVIKSFPVKAIGEQIYDSDLKKALTESDVKGELKCLLGFYGYNNEVLFLLGPQKMDFPIFYKGATHTLSVYFWTNDYSYGYKNPQTGEMEGRIILATAIIDNDESKNYINNSPTTASVPMVFSTLIK